MTWRELTLISEERSPILERGPFVGRLKYSAISMRAFGLSARPTKPLNAITSCTTTPIVTKINCAVTHVSNNLTKESDFSVEENAEQVSREHKPVNGLTLRTLSEENIKAGGINKQTGKNISLPRITTGLVTHYTPIPQGI